MSDSLRRPLKLVRGSRSLFINDIAEKRPHHYMSITKEAHFKMHNNGASDESFKKRFTAERSRKFDILQANEATFLSVEGCSERASEFSLPGYQLRPSDGRN